jgi:hypothetical protein
LYEGISITNTGAVPRSRVFFSSMAINGASTSPSRYMAKMTSPGTHHSAYQPRPLTAGVTNAAVSSR